MAGLVVGGIIAWWLIENQLVWEAWAVIIVSTLLMIFFPVAAWYIFLTAIVLGIIYLLAITWWVWMSFMFGVILFFLGVVSFGKFAEHVMAG